MVDERIKKAEEKLRHAQRDILEAEEALQGEDAIVEDVEEQARAAPVPKAAPAPKATPAAVPKQAAAPAAASSGGKWRVEYDRENCIGAGACVAANADFWSIDEDGKAILKSATYDEGKKRWVLEIADDAQLQKQRDAAGVCPVGVIHIIDPDGNQEI